MKIIIATDNRFWRGQFGSQKRIFSLLSYLHTKFEIVVFFTGVLDQRDQYAVAELPYKIYIADDCKHSVSDFPLLLMRFKQKLFLIIKKIFLLFSDLVRFGYIDNSPLLEDFVNLKLKKKFVDILKKECAEVLLVEYLRLGYLIDTSTKKNGKGLITVVDTHDVSSQRHMRFLKQRKKSDLRITIEQEIQSLNDFDITVAIQNEDASFFKKNGVKQVIIVPHSVPLISLDVKNRETLQLGFVGSSMTPNVEGISWFISEIMPYLDGVILNIYGSVCGQLDVSGQHIKLHGFVDNIFNCYEGSDIIINPVSFGGGLKIKSIEALSFGLPLLSTSVGLEGMEPGKGSIICNHKNDWVSRINELKNKDVREKMSKAAVEYINKYFSESTCYKPLVDSINSVYQERIKNDI